MSWGAYFAGAATAMLSEHGEAMTLRRQGTPNVDVTVMAKQYGSTESIVVNSQTRQRMTIKLSNAEIAAAAWPIPIRPKDQFIDVRGKTWIVVEADMRSHEGVVAAHMVTVVG